MSYTKDWANRWLDSGTALPTLTVTPIVREFTTERRNNCYVVTVLLSNDDIVEIESWSRPDPFWVMSRSLADVRKHINEENLHSWRERHRSRRNPPGCYGWDTLDRLVGL